MTSDVPLAEGHAAGVSILVTQFGEGVGQARFGEACCLGESGESDARVYIAGPIVEEARDEKVAGFGVIMGSCVRCKVGG